MYKLNHRPQITIEDKYFHIREDKDNAIKIAKKENESFKLFLDKHSKLQNELFEEIKFRSNVNYKTYPFKTSYDSKVKYYYSFDTESPYFQFYRKYNDIDELILDVNEMAKGKEYYDVNICVFKDNKHICYCVDDKGNELYDVYYMNIDTKETLKLDIPPVPYSEITLSPNCNDIFYSQADDKMWVNSIWKFNIEKKNSVKIYEEKNDVFSVGTFISADEKYLLISSGSTESDEHYFSDINNPTNLILIKKRSENLLYHCDISNNTIFIKTNIGKNKKETKNNEFRLVYANVNNPNDWYEKVKFPEDKLLKDFSVYKNFVLLFVTVNGYYKVYRLDKDNSITELNITNEPSTIYESRKYYDQDIFFFSVVSYIQPSSIIKYDNKNSTTKLVWSKKVNNYSKDNYESYSIEVPSFYGEKVPVSIIKHKNTPIKNSNLYLYGYGAYGMSMEPDFSTGIISVLDRGLVYAVAHVRGGSEKGRKWFLDGKVHNKMNSFLDVITVAEYFKRDGCNKIALEGRSAGGLLVGASMILRPDLFTSVILGVPFVDVIATMCDSTIPLTTSEYDEWGNPHKKEDYVYMKQYSPIDNIRKTNYPNTLLLGGISDPRVQYWEPLKFHLKLKDYKTDENNHFLKMDLGSGHFGLNNKFKAYQEKAEQLTFVLANM